ncbi:MAG: hypothetical protein AAB444_02230 [Patescibacteria group bacterium]
MRTTQLFGTVLCAAMVMVMTACGDFERVVKCGRGTMQKGAECVALKTATTDRATIASGPDGTITVEKKTEMTGIGTTGTTTSQEGIEEDDVVCGKGTHLEDESDTCVADEQESTEVIKEVEVPVEVPVANCGEGTMEKDGECVAWEPEMCDAICTRQSKFLNQATNPPLSDKEITIMFEGGYTCTVNQETPTDHIFQVNGQVIIGAEIPHSTLRIRGRVELKNLQGAKMKLDNITMDFSGMGHYHAGDTGSSTPANYAVSGPVDKSGNFVIDRDILMPPWDAEVDFRAFLFTVDLMVGMHVHDEIGSWVEWKILSPGEIIQLGVKTITLEFTNIELFMEGQLLETTFIESCEPITTTFKME